MILDMQSLFSDAQAVTVTAASTNVLDTGVSRELGRGTPLPLLVQVVTTFTAGGAATMTVAYQVDNDVAFGSAQTLYTSAAIAVATLVAGYRFLLDRVPEYTAAKADARYHRFNYTIATGPMLSGAITAGLVMGRQSVGFPT